MPVLTHGMVGFELPFILRMRTVAVVKVARMRHARLRPRGDPCCSLAAGRDRIPLRGVLAEISKQLLYRHAIDGNQLVADREGIAECGQQRAVDRVDQQHAVIDVDAKAELCDKIGGQDKRNVRIIQAGDELDAHFVKIQVGGGARDASQPRPEIPRVESKQLVLPVQRRVVGGIEAREVSKILFFLRSSETLCKGGVRGEHERESRDGLFHGSTGLGCG